MIPLPPAAAASAAARPCRDSGRRGISLSSERPVPCRDHVLRAIALACRLVLVASLLLAACGLGLAAWRFPVAAGLILASGPSCGAGYRRRRATDAHGSARMASFYEMEKAGLFADDGLLLGRALPEAPSLAAAAAALVYPLASRSETACRGFFAAAYSKRWRSEQLIRTNRHVHLATFSPSGGGKGIAAMIPNLLSYPGNCLLSTSRANCSARPPITGGRHSGRRRTGSTRSRSAGRAAIRSTRSISWMKQKADFLDRVRAFANPIIIRSRRGETAAFQRYGGADARRPLRLRLRLPARPRAAAPGHGAALRLVARPLLPGRRADAKDRRRRGVIRRLAGQLSFAAEEEQGSIFTTFTRQTEFLDSPLVARNVASSSASTPWRSKPATPIYT